MTTAQLARLTGQDALLSLSLAVVGGAAGYLVVRDPIAAGAVALAPIALWLFAKRRIACLLLGSSIPFAQDVTGGRLGVNLAVSDLLMVLIFVSVIAEALLTRQFAAGRALAALRFPLLQYLALMLVLLVYHVGLRTFFQTGQRFELLLLPLIIGAVIALQGNERQVLRAYVIAATVLGAAWPFIVSGDQGLGIQKNPAGQFIANALLVLVAVKGLRRLLPVCLPILVAGLLATLSRGAITSVGVGLIVLTLVQPGRSRARSALLVLPLAMLTAVAFLLLPAKDQERTTTFTAGTETSGQYALTYRQEYWKDARAIIDANPVSGVGVGHYSAGSVQKLTLTSDPHQVLLLQAAEGGYPLAISFLVLIIGTVVVLIARFRRVPLGPVAVAVTLATFSHGLVDIYWVRATPVFAWMLVGMAMATLAKSELAPTK